MPKISGLKLLHYPALLSMAMGICANVAADWPQGDVATASERLR